MKGCPYLCLALCAGLWGGCAVLNTFQSPVTLAPGRTDLEAALAVAPAILREASENEPRTGEEAPGAILGHGYFTLRTGLAEGVEMNVSSGIGPGSLGAGVKVRLATHPVLVSANAGLSRSAFVLNFYSFTSHHTRAAFGGLLAGTEHFYAGAKVTRLYDRHVDDCDVCQPEERLFDGWVPQLTLGARHRRTPSPMIEANVYFVPEPLLTLGMGFRFKLAG